MLKLINIYLICNLDETVDQSCTKNDISWDWQWNHTYIAAWSS